MFYFTRDNTDGFNERELDQLNRTLEAAYDIDKHWLKDADDDVLDSHIKNLADMVMTDFIDLNGKR